MPRPILPIRAGDRPPEPPAFGGLGPEGWSRGATFLEFVEGAGEHRAEIEAAFRGVDPPAAVAEFFAGYPRRVRVLALADVHSLDARVNVAQAERLFSLGSKLWMRIFAPERHSEVVQRLSPAGVESLLFVFFGDGPQPLGRWGPRPRRLQELGAGRAPAELGALARSFYAQSRGLDLAEELRALLEGQRGEAP